MTFRTDSERESVRQKREGSAEERNTEERERERERERESTVYDRVCVRV